MAPEFPPSTVNPPVNSTLSWLVVEMGNATSIRSTGERSGPANPPIDIAQKLDTDSFPSTHPDGCRSKLDNGWLPGHWGRRLSAQARAENKKSVLNITFLMKRRSPDIV